MLDALPSDFVVEHVGSTAIPGMPSKPMIDLMLGAPSLEEAQAVIPTLADLGYQYMPEHEQEIPDRRFFAFPSTRPRQFHLHAVKRNGAFWHKHILFRDRLAAQRELAQEYADLKRSLAARFHDDRAAYTETKTPFILQVLQRE